MSNINLISLSSKGQKEGNSLDIKQLKSVAEEIVVATSKILNDVTVAIVDQNGNYMAIDEFYIIRKGTEEWKPYIDEIIKKRKVTIIENPGLNPLCKGCENEGNCPQTLEISVPFNFDNRFFGYISVITFSNEMKDYYIKRIDQTVEYLNSMVKLMVSAAKEQATRIHAERMFSEREAIINSMNYGVVDCDIDGRIKCANHTFCNFIGADRPIENQLITEILTSTAIEEVLNNKGELEGREAQVFINNEMHRMVVSATVIKSESNEDIGFVFSLHKAAYIRSLVFGSKEECSENALSSIIGKSAAMIELRKRIESIANSCSTVMINGETGTGKELVARAIHSLSSRRDKPIVTINCAAIPDNLLESELFGYEEGAFTGGRKGGKAGIIEVADGGTLFLDEIGDMPLHLQAKLLRVLQEKEILRIGGYVPTPIDIRVISATHQDLDELIKRQLFRMDLYYRLNIIPIEISPLREHISDIDDLIDYFIMKYNHKLNKQIIACSRDYIEAMKQYTWPGNVRELENAIEYSINIQTGNILTTDSLLQKISDYDLEERSTMSLKQRTLEYERKVIQNVVKQYKNESNGIEKAAHLLGISRASLYRKLKG